MRVEQAAALATPLAGEVGLGSEASEPGEGGARNPYWSVWQFVTGSDTPAEFIIWMGRRWREFDAHKGRNPDDHQPHDEDAHRLFLTWLCERFKVSVNILGHIVTGEPPPWPGRDEASHFKARGRAAEARVDLLIAEGIRIAKDRDSWKHEFEMYRDAWVRELGGSGKLLRKAHLIDALTMTTAHLRRRSDYLEEIELKAAGAAMVAEYGPWGRTKP